MRQLGNLRILQAVSLFVMLFCVSFVAVNSGCRTPQRKAGVNAPYVEEVRNALQGETAENLAAESIQLIRSTPEPADSDTFSWQIRVAPSVQGKFALILKNVGRVGSVHVGGRGNTKLVEIALLDKPIGILVHDPPLTEEQKGGTNPYPPSCCIGSSIEVVCDGRQYGRNALVARGFITATDEIGTIGAVSRQSTNETGVSR